MAEINSPPGFGNWQRRAIAPDYVPRPNNKVPAGFYFFFRNSVDTSDFEILYDALVTMTINGQLGHYVGISDDGEVIAVHHSKFEDPWETKKIEKRLCKLGIFNFQHREKDIMKQWF